MSTSSTLSSVRSHIDAAVWRIIMDVRSSNWSQEGRPRMAVPMALMPTAPAGASGAWSRCDTTTAVDPSQGTSQS